MGFIKKFSYPDIFQRRVLFINTFITFLILGFIFSDSVISLKYYFIYQSVLSVMFLSCFFGLLAGNLLGKLFYSKFENFRRIYIISEMLFILFVSLYYVRHLIFAATPEPIISLFLISPFLAFSMLILVPLCAGIKINYFLKVSCGVFIDEKKGTIPFIQLALIGIVFGILMAVALSFATIVYPGLIITTLVLLPSLFLLKFPYSPAPLYAREFKEEGPETIEVSPNNTRDKLLFTFLNFSYILIYIFLGHECIIKYYDDIIAIRAYLIVLTLSSISLGLLIGHYSRRAFWYVYTEMLFPIFFLFFLILVLLFQNDYSFYIVALFFVPCGLLYGFSLYHTIENILITYDHGKRFNIINLSIFILPAPILLVISYFDFTYLGFFILLYALVLLNIIFPGLHLLQGGARGIYKGLYFIFSLVFIPLLFLVHLYFSIPLDTTSYRTNVSGYDTVRAVNFNSDYISKRADLFLKGTRIFTIDESNIKNLKRALVPVFFFRGPDSDGILLINGNHKFMRNTVVGYFNNITNLDYVPDRIVDYQKLSLTGSPRYVLEQASVISFLQQIRKNYGVIIDLPNKFDQKRNPFRFSSEYLSLAKKSIKRDGIFVQIIDITSCRNESMVSSVQGFKKYFKKVIGFVFANIIVLMGTDDDMAFVINEKNLLNLEQLFNAMPQARVLFFSKYHFLSHLLFPGMDDILLYLRDVRIEPQFYLESSERALDRSRYIDIERFMSNISGGLELFDKAVPSLLMKQDVQSELLRNKTLYVLLNKAELAEAMGEYQKETELLFQLKRYTEYNAELRTYINKLLAFKEESYFNAALRLEKKKKWNEAKKLYHAIITINNDNFEANYRLGLLYVTLQELDDSFRFFQNAMRIKKDDPKVLSQIGILLFSQGLYKNALEFLNRARDLHDKSASLYLYIGLCYEKLDRYHEARRYYNDALLKDPNDKNIVASIDRINKKIIYVQNRWAMPERSNQKETERGEKVPLPIIKSAIDQRLDDGKAEEYEEEKKQRYGD